MVLGTAESFLPDNSSLLQKNKKKKYNSEINLHECAFSNEKRNRRKVSENSRIVVFRILAVWNNKIIQAKGRFYAMITTADERGNVRVRTADAPYTCTRRNTQEIRCNQRILKHSLISSS